MTRASGVRPETHLLVACLVVLLTACGTRMAHIDTGAPLTDQDLAMGWVKPENRAADDFSEQLVIRGWLPDGASFYAKLTVTNLASADGRADLTASVELADKRKLRFKAKAERDDWTFAPDRFRAEVGDGAIELGVGRARVVCKNDDFELDAEVVSTQPPLRPPGGLVQSAAGWYVTTIPIPRGELRVKLTVHNMPEAPEPEDGDGNGNGDKPPDGSREPPAEPAPEPTPEAPSEPAPDVTPGAELPDAPADPARGPLRVTRVAGEVGEVPAEGAEPAEEPEADEDDDDDDDGPVELELEGVAYAEHRMSTLTPYALAHRWHGIVDVGEERTVVFSAFEHAKPKGAKATDPATEPVVQGWILVAEDDGIVLYEPELVVWVRDWTTDAKTGYGLPGLVFVSDRDRRTFEGVIKTNSLSERKDDLASLKKLERLVVRRFIKPWTFRYDRAEFLFRKQLPEEPRVEVRGAARFQYQQLNE